MTALLTSAGIGVLQHRDIHEISLVYRECGVDLGAFELYRGKPRDGYAVIVPPRRHSPADLGRIPSPVTFAVTGWATNSRGVWGWTMPFPCQTTLTTTT